MHLYNTLSGKKEIFNPSKTQGVNIFVCGPTVYDASHIGHARTYIFFDIAIKYLKTAGFKVFYLQNITDIDDKIIARAREMEQDPLFLSRHLTKEYFQDMRDLKVTAVTKYAPATKFISNIIFQIKSLIKKGYVYEIKEDGLYFDIKKFPEYGKLSHRTTEQAEDAVSRIDDSIKKRNKGDFCVWKFVKPNEPSWNSPWGKGRPGWHIEDTAISEHFFGPQYDIHGGGIDLKFPHHESEIAQQEAASGKKPFVKFWLHTGFLRVEGKKMSKSLKNFITIHNMLKKYSAEAFRLLVLQNHYRSPLNYTDTSIQAAEEGINRLKNFKQRLEKIQNPKSEILNKSQILNSKFKNDLLKKFNEAMENDFDTPKVIANIFDFINKTNGLIDKNKLSKKDSREVMAFFKKINSVLNIIPKIKTEEIPEKIEKLAKLREQYRKEKKWTEADKVRKQIYQSGFEIKDTAEGTILIKSYLNSR